MPVNKTQKQILSFLIENPNNIYSDLAERTGKTRETIRVNLRKLEEIGIIKRIGADKNGHWIVYIK